MTPCIHQVLSDYLKSYQDASLHIQAFIKDVCSELAKNICDKYDLNYTEVQNLYVIPAMYKFSEKDREKMLHAKVCKSRVVNGRDCTQQAVVDGFCVTHHPGLNNYRRAQKKATAVTKRIQKRQDRDALSIMFPNTGRKRRRDNVKVAARNDTSQDPASPHSMAQEDGEDDYEDDDSSEELLLPSRQQFYDDVDGGKDAFAVIMS